MTENEWFCYILRTSYPEHINRTYNGSTNSLERRIRQHNQQLSGGAKYTRRYGGKQWQIYCYVTGFPDRKNALQCEWRIKHPDNRRVRPSRYNNPKGRINGLVEVLKSDRWTSRSTVDNKDIDLQVYVVDEFIDLFTDLPKNIHINLL